MIAGVIGVLALVGLWITLPKLKPTRAANLADLMEVAIRPRALVVLVSVLVVISGHFASFTYIRPVLEQVAHLDVAAISLVLLAFGCAGFIGNFVGAFLAERDPKLAIIGGSALMAASMAGLVLFGASPWLAGLALMLWGMAFAALPVGFQAWMVTDVPDRPELGGGLLTAAFQVAIATGAVAGGLLVDRFGVLSGAIYCGAAAAAGFCLVLGLRRHRAVRDAACYAA
ncbi:MAG: MFS transporter [Caulobacteraceae bacterium]|nr:MAG: MFS transporter [Caulobacteraceae bacterium]